MYFIEHEEREDPVSLVSITKAIIGGGIGLLLLIVR